MGNFKQSHFIGESIKTENSNDLPKINRRSGGLLMAIWSSCYLPNSHSFTDTSGQHQGPQMFREPFLNYLFFKKSLPGICLLILEKEEGRGRKEGREEGRRERERIIDWLPPIGTLTKDQTCNLGTCPDQELNPWPFGVWDDAPTEPLGQGTALLFKFWLSL